MTVSLSSTVFLPTLFSIIFANVLFGRALKGGQFCQQWKCQRHGNPSFMPGRFLFNSSTVSIFTSETSLLFWTRYYADFWSESIILPMPWIPLFFVVWKSRELWFDRDSMTGRFSTLIWQKISGRDFLCSRFSFSFWKFYTLRNVDFLQKWQQIISLSWGWGWLGLLKFQTQKQFSFDFDFNLWATSYFPSSFSSFCSFMSLLISDISAMLKV